MLVGQVMIHIPAKYQTRNLYGYGNLPPDMSKSGISGGHLGSEQVYQNMSMLYLVAHSLNIDMFYHKSRLLIKISIRNF